ncbi:thiamine phosphate synthase [Aeromicrobium sp. UC242_57]|uniref:thiamine phosphate synthase n=1 Tax=Aeromicrobium sp. UC242_57 TaxID=3374624 RepID=UPI00378D716E
MSIDLRLYLVTDPSCDDLGSVVTAAVAGGATCVQVRDKSGTSADRLAAVAALRAALPASVAVLANDDVAAARAGDGLHVGVGDTDPVTARAALGEDAVIGWSVNDLRQLDDAVQLAACDYVAASPVWATPTKTDTTAPFGLDGVRELAKRLGGRLPLIAIGGIDAANARDVIAAGANGVAVVSAICAADDPAGAAASLRLAVDDALQARGVHA